MNSRLSEPGSQGGDVRSGGGEVQPSPLGKILVFVVRLALGVVLVAASVDKIIHPKAFADIVHNYQLLPDQLVNIVAIVLPWLELTLGMLILAGIWLPGAVTLANILLLVFFSTLVLNAVRGLDVHCGCFSTSEKGKATLAWSILRDGMFLLMGAFLLFQTVLGKARNDRAGDHRLSQ